MKKKIITAAIAAVITLGMLSGCGKAKETPVDETVADETVTDEAAGQEAAGQEAASEVLYLKDIKVDEYVTLGEYKGLEIIIQEPEEISDEDVDEYIDQIMSQYPMYTEVDGVAQDGQEVNIDYEGKIDEVAFDGGTAAGSSLVLGSNTFIADLEAGMIGMSTGETKDIPVTFPEDYHSAELAGKEAVFTVTLNSIIEYPEPALTDEYVDWLTQSEMTTVADFKQYINEMMSENAITNYESEKLGLVTDAAFANCEFKEMPAGLITRMINMVTSSINSYAGNLGLTAEAYLMYSQMLAEGETADDFIATQAQASAENYIMLKAIADLEGLNVTEEEGDAALAAEAEMYGYALEEYKALGDIDSYMEFLMIDKVSQFLVDNAVIKAE